VRTAAKSKTKLRDAFDSIFVDETGRRAVSIYAWTNIIGVVLAGISIGAWIGGAV
jgi:hypothetical protein